MGGAAFSMLYLFSYIIFYFLFSTACRHGSKSGIVDSFESHQGPVTAISTHKSRGSLEFPDLFLTSSFDWTVKLWNLKVMFYMVERKKIKIGWSEIEIAK